MSQLQTASQLRQIDKVSGSIKDTISKLKITQSQIINWALITAEFQTAHAIISKLRKISPDTLHFKLEERMRVLEEQQKQELLLAFNIHTSKGQLATTPVYDILHPNELYNYYIMSVHDYGEDTLGMGMRDVALVRSKSKIIYTANAPIFKISQFLNSDGYIELLKDDSISNEKLEAIHLTLIMLYLTESESYHTVLNSGALDLDTLETLQLDDVII